MNTHVPERRASRWAEYSLVGTFVLVAGTILTAGHFSYQHFEQGFLVQVERKLAAVADLKVGEIANWRRERLADGVTFATNTVFSGLVRQWTRDPRDGRAEANLRMWLGSVQAAGGYDRVILVSARGAPWICAPGSTEPVASHLLLGIPDALRSGQVSFLDLHRDTPDGPIRMAVQVPIFDGIDKRGLAVLVLRIDPEGYLYPLLQRWPTDSATAETLLVRREGSDVLFLSELRFQKNTALTLHRPLATQKLPAAAAVLGRDRIIEGVDYRGVAVVAATRTVPDSPWSLVARMDSAEIYAPLRRRQQQMVAILGGLLLAAGAFVGLVWHRQKLRAASLRYQTAEALGASQRLIAGIIDTIPARVFWKDEDLRFLGCNTAFAKDAGLAEPKDVVGKTDYEMPWRDQADLYRNDDRQVIESGRPRTLVEEPQTTPEGNTVTLLTSKTPLRNSKGEVSGVLGTYLDISERKRADAAQYASELRYRRLFESARDGILILDAATGMIVDVNPFLVELLSFSREAFLGKKVQDLGFFKDVLANEANFLELQRKGYVRYDDMALETSDGRRIEVEFVSNVYLVNDERVIQCNIRDISERHRAQEVNVRLATAVEHAAEAIVITDPVGSILYVNPAFERSSGYSREEALGQNPRILKSGKHDADFYAALWTVLRRGEVWSGHFINKRKDGSLYEEDSSIAPIRDASGQVVNYVAVNRDMTNEVRLSQQLFQSQKMEAVGRLAGGIAHDFNNLLAIVVGYGDIVLRQLPGNDPLKDKVAQILKAADRAAGLTRQLLAFSRKQVLQPKILALNVVVSDLAKMLPRVLGEDVELTTRLAADLGNVKADPGQIEQVLMNLAVNARDAMPLGGKIIIETQNADLDASYALTHQPAPTGQYVLLAVSDTGSGMDAATQAQIFDPFFTTKGVGKGSGLGLSTVYGIVKQSGGYIWVYSEVGVGTTFKILLPRVDEKALSVRHEARGPLPKGSETVLLVEDEVSLRQLLQETLETSGYSVLVAQDGAQALRIAEVHPGPIEIMVTDVIMPGMTGPKVVEFLVETRPGVKVVFISGYSEEAVAQHGLEGPGRTFVSKPFSPETLLRRIRELLDADR
jgi:two-component system cell cycle sensor histidine kinase/response regulator CckA